ncbi:MAG TPA: bifunctional phosphoribosyl-AMP cyclohydrolase/phosphoribosyl-ATP diphosphatase HisIE [Aequorivita sp.]|nr:bifunctional phosphoribosyl-AMP cyclohydrolase/phosphoribosyl-ATP diphosphatase HisIE [Aequorivita sp.]
MNPDFKKGNGLIPVIVQDNTSLQVLMLGYMNEAAFLKTQATKKVTFYSRSKKRLWTKGEESGNYLQLVEIKVDCDADALLVLAKPEGPVCHTGSDTCWNEKNKAKYGFLSELEQIINDRKITASPKESYVSSLFEKGLDRIAQKVGEEAVETIIEAKNSNRNNFLNEAADLLFHYLMLLTIKDVNFEDVVEVLKSRHKK